MPVPARFEPELFTSAIRHALHVQEQRIVHSLRRVVLHRNFAVNAVPVADEAKRDVFGYINSPARKNGHLLIEFFNAKFSRRQEGSKQESSREKNRETQNRKSDEV